MKEASSLVLKSGREKPLIRRHPWIFSGAVKEVRGDPAPGETVNILSSRGEFLAQAAYSPHSQIRARAWNWDADRAIDAAFFQERIGASIARRSALAKTGQTDALRLIFAESDGLPGLIVDRYADTLVVQFLTCGVEFWREVILEALREETGLELAYERSDIDQRELEGLPPRNGWLSASIGETRIQIEESGLHFIADIEHGHKTGFYLDQRANRLRVRDFVPGRELLDCFPYSGGFALNALVAGAASVVAVDESAEALDLLRENLALNGLSDRAHELIQTDVFKALRTFRDQGRRFDMVILDPPKFAATRAQVDRAARGYKDINLLAFKLLRPGGILATFSCSGGVERPLFHKIVADAALDAGVDAQIIAQLSQDADHPVALNFPEGEYLKGLICRIA